MNQEVKEKPRCAVVASVQLPGVSDPEFEASLNELREQANTLACKTVHTLYHGAVGLGVCA